MPTARSTSPSAAQTAGTGVQRADSVGGQAADPARRQRSRQTGTAVGRDGPVGMRQDNAAQLSGRASQTGLGKHQTEQRKTQQTVETENLLRSTAGHLLSRPLPPTDFRGWFFIVDLYCQNLLPNGDDAFRYLIRFQINRFSIDLKIV